MHKLDLASNNVRFEVKYSVEEHVKCNSLITQKAEHICGAIGQEDEVTPLLVVSVIYKLSFKIN